MTTILTQRNTVFDGGEYSVETPNQETIDAIMYSEAVDDLLKDLYDD